jgi:hypothetical protein
MQKNLHYKNLEKMHLSAPCNDYYSPSLTVSKGGAEVKIPVEMPRGVPRAPSSWMPNRISRSLPRL